MRTAPLITPPPTRDGSPLATAPDAATAAPQAIPVVPQSMPMDREFILRNQIAERYLAGTCRCAAPTISNATAGNIPS